MTSIPPLHLSNYPVVGPEGKRDNVQRLSMLIAVMAALPGNVLLMSIRHDDKCPCADGLHPQEDCTCDTVDVTVNAVEREGPSPN